MIVEDGEGMCQCQDCARNDVKFQKDASRSSMDYKVPEGENQNQKPSLCSLGEPRGVRDTRRVSRCAADWMHAVVCSVKTRCGKC